MNGITVDGVTVSYNGTPALVDSNLAVAMGEWVALIGPNGAGKSTLLRAVAGTVSYRGEIEIAGRPAASLSRRARSRRVAVVPQSPVLPEDMTAGEYVLLGRTPHLGYWAAESRHDLEVASGALRRLEGQDLAGRRLGRLSGGERQRVVLARALAQESPVLLLDEPTTALDIGHQQTVLDLVQGLRRERRIAVLSAVHDLTMAAQYADRLVLLDGGRVVAEGSPGEVLTEEHLARFPGARVSVLHGPDGSLIVAPRRERTSLPQRVATGD
jgi:iron complex transport system ATP-binding protein